MPLAEACPRLMKPRRKERGRIQPHTSCPSEDVQPLGHLPIPSLLREQSALPNQHLCIWDTNVRCPRLRPANLLIRSPRRYLRSLGRQLTHYPSPNSQAHHIRRTSPWFLMRYPPPPLRNRHTSHKVYELESPFPSTAFHLNAGVIIYRTSACTWRAAMAPLRLELRRWLLTLPVTIWGWRGRGGLAEVL